MKNYTTEQLALIQDYAKDSKACGLKKCTGCLFGISVDANITNCHIVTDNDVPSQNLPHIVHKECKTIVKQLKLELIQEILS